MKDSIQYLEREDLVRYRDELLAMKLARWRYTFEPSKERVGFIIDDDPKSSAVDPKRNIVDLYGYTSMAVAALKLQAEQIQQLQRQVEALRRSVGANVCRPEAPLHAQ